MLRGYYGTGKTVVSWALLKRLADEAASRGLRLATTYLNCGRNMDTQVRVTRELLRSVKSASDKAGMGSNEYVNALCEEAKRFDYWIVVLDEFDKLLANKNQRSKLTEADGLFYVFSREVPNLSTIMITNKMNTPVIMVEALDGRTTDTFRYRIIEFQDYDATQLADILGIRLDEALRPNSYDQGIVNYIASKALLGGLRARGLIQIANRAAEIADEQYARKLTVEIVDEAVRALNAAEPVRIIETLAPPQKSILAWITTQKHSQVTSEEYDAWYDTVLAPKFGLPKGRMGRYRLVGPLSDMNLLEQIRRGHRQGGSTVIYRIPDYLHATITRILLREDTPTPQ